MDILNNLHKEIDQGSQDKVIAYILELSPLTSVLHNKWLLLNE